MNKTSAAAAATLLAVSALITADPPLAPDPSDGVRQAPASVEQARQQRPRPAMRAPVLLRRSSALAPVPLRGEGSIHYAADGPSTIAIADVPRESRGISLEEATQRYVRGGPRIESLFTDQDVLNAQAWAWGKHRSRGVQVVAGLGAEEPSGFFAKFLKRGPKLKRSWDAIDGRDCCEGTGFSAFVPPDPDMAVGPDHVIVVVNTAFEVYDKKGEVLVPATELSTFFDGTEGCTAFAPIPGFPGLFGATFDPDVVYDEEHDRFVMGIDGNGTDYCVAATVTGDPTGAWNRYGFPTNVNGAFFDFPHMGVGLDAIYMGSNQFGGTLPFGFEGRVFAMDKLAMYNGDPLQVVTREVTPAGEPNIRLDGTPQPAQLHGFRQKTWPRGGPHYIMTEYFDGKVHSVYAWNDPFGRDEFDLVGDVDLAAATGVECENFSCFPVPWPQAGSPEILEANDFRGQETEYRNGRLWTSQTISCNPGDGTVDCIRWAEIRPTRVEPGVLNLDTFELVATTDGVRQAGVFASDGDFRSFPSLAVNHCNDMAIGYSAGNAETFPSVYVSGRRFFDRRGEVRDEVLLKEGESAYTSFQDNGGAAPVRWGDYSGMTIDPDGSRFWYVGEYARDTSDPDNFNALASWATYVGAFEFFCPTPRHDRHDDDDDDDERRRGGRHGDDD